MRDTFTMPLRMDGSTCRLLYRTQCGRRSVLYNNSPVNHSAYSYFYICTGHRTVVPQPLSPFHRQ